MGRGPDSDVGRDRSTPPGQPQPGDPRGQSQPRQSSPGTPPPGTPRELTFEAVVVVRGGRRALDGFDGSLPLRGVSAVVGPSGAGKSTLLRLCNRLEVPASGRVLLDGVDLADIDPLALRRRVGMVFQRPTPFDGTVAANVRAGAPELSDAQVTSLLEEVSLGAEFAPREARALSGGEAQRVCLARALAVAPDALLLDEPTSALDAESAAAVERAVLVRSGAGLGVVWVTHDAGQVERVADRVLRVEAGRCAGLSDPRADNPDREPA